MSHSSLFKSSCWSWTVSESNQRADLILLKAFENRTEPKSKLIPDSLNRSQLKKLFEEGQITQDGIQIKAGSKLKVGSIVQIVFNPPEPSILIPEKRPLDILYEDPFLLVINKPPGLTVHPSPTQMQGTLVHALLHHIQDLSGIGGVLRPGIVHRIDKHTSGALVITKTDQAHASLAKTFSLHQIERVYHAICYGTPKNSKFCEPFKIESLIGRHPVDRKKMSMKVKAGRKAITHIVKKQEFKTSRGDAPFASFLEIQLETGRTHQVRVHLAGTGNSILGDPVYGVPRPGSLKWLCLPEVIQSAVRQLPGQALHAQVLGFQHPITGEKLRFEAPAPAAFQTLFELLQPFRGS